MGIMFSFNMGFNFIILKMGPELFSCLAAQADNFIDAFAHENLAPGYEIVVSL